MARTLCYLTIRFFVLFVPFCGYSGLRFIFASLREIFCLLFCGAGGSLKPKTIENRPGLRASQKLEIIMGCTVRRAGFG